MCGLSESVLSANPKATYIGALDDGHLAALRSGSPTVVAPIPLQSAEAYWNLEHARRVLEARTPQAAARRARFAASTKKELVASVRIKEGAARRHRSR